MIILNTVQKEIENNISCWLVVFEKPVLVDEWYRPSHGIVSFNSCRLNWIRSELVGTDYVLVHECRQSQ
jgi:hypothetical protein